MVLQTGSDPGELESISIEVDISITSAKLYAQTFKSGKLSKNSLLILDCSILKALGIKTEWNTCHTKACQRTPSFTSIASRLYKSTNCKTFSKKDNTTILKVQNRQKLLTFLYTVKHSTLQLRWWNCPELYYQHLPWFFSSPTLVNHLTCLKSW